MNTNYFANRIGLITKVTFKNGDVLHLAIQKVEGNKVFYVKNIVLSEIEKSNYNQKEKDEMINNPENQLFFLIEDVILD